MQEALKHFVRDFAPSVVAPRVSLRDGGCAWRWCLAAARNGDIPQGEEALELKPFVGVLRKLFGRDLDGEVKEWEKSKHGNLHAMRVG